MEKGRFIQNPKEALQESSERARKTLGTLVHLDTARSKELLTESSQALSKLAPAGILFMEELYNPPPSSTEAVGVRIIGGLFLAGLITVGLGVAASRRGRNVDNEASSEEIDGQNVNGATSAARIPRPEPGHLSRRQQRQHEQFVRDLNNRNRPG